jgi:hypothetical protein
MTATTPLSVAEYTSPLPINVQAAIGRFITSWSRIEHVLALQVGRLAATHVDYGGPGFNIEAFLRCSLLAGGTHPRALTAQIVTLAQIHRYRHHAALKAAGDKLLKVRERRDDVAHLLATPKGPNSFSLKAMAGSKSKPFIEKIFTVDDLDQWCAKLRAHSMEIDSRVTEITGWSWTHISEEFGVEI